MRVRNGTVHSLAVRRAHHGSLLAGILLAMVVAPLATAADQWPQWRGPMRTGNADDGPELRKSLPPEGLEPVWLSEKIPGGGSGGWGSPVIANDRVYIFVPTRTRREDVQLPPRKFPSLSDEESDAMGEEEFRDYEEKRRKENLERARQFRYEEILYCLDRHSGETIWKTSEPGQYARFVPSVTPAINCCLPGKAWWQPKRHPSNSN